MEISFVNLFILSYGIIDSVRGFMDPPRRYTAMELIQMDNYSVENHYVTTSDGYILNIHRIPTGKQGKSTSKVVFLEHGLLSSSVQWIISGPGNALGYILADEGYDVWMCNVRGNFYSRNHTTLNPDNDDEFWNFSWHEVGIYDLPATIDYILYQTGNSSLYYVGHSQGTTSMYVMASEVPGYNSKIKLYVSLSPVAYMKHVQSPLVQELAEFKITSEVLATLLGSKEFIPNDSFIRKFSSTLCGLGVPGTVLCANAFFVLFGFTPRQTNYTLVPQLNIQFPAGAATKQLRHYLQEIRSGHFRQYEYSVRENLKRYNSTTPPDYNMTKVTAPGHIIYAREDWFADFKIDVPKLYEQLGNCRGKHLLKVPYNHLDYLFGIHASTDIYSKILNLFENN